MTTYPSVTSVTANDKGDNEVKLEIVHRSPGICLMVEENPGKHNVRYRLIKALLLFIASNGVHNIQMMSVGSHNMSAREKKGN